MHILSGTDDAHKHSSALFVLLGTTEQVLCSLCSANSARQWECNLLCRQERSEADAQSLCKNGWKSSWNGVCTGPSNGVYVGRCHTFLFWVPVLLPPIISICESRASFCILVPFSHLSSYVDFCSTNTHVFISFALSAHIQTIYAFA